MTTQTPFGMPQFDPSKMDPQALMQMSQLFQQLSPAQMSKMQTLMHNMMGGFDVRKEMEEFEKSLPQDFREKLTALVAGSGMGMGMGMFGGGAAGGAGFSEAPAIEVEAHTDGGAHSGEMPPEGNMDVHQARITILRAVQNGQMTPEEAEKLLFIN